MKAPGEVHNPLQIFIRIFIALLILAVVGGFIWALFR